MTEKREVKTITIERVSGSKAKASVNENGKRSEAEAPTLEQALANAVKKQKE